MTQAQKECLDQLQAAQENVIKCLQNISLKDSATGGKLREAMRQLNKQMERRIEA